MSRSKDEIIKNSMIRDRLLNEEPVKDVWKRRHFLLADRSSRIKNGARPKRSLATTAVVKRTRGRPHGVARDVMVDSISNVVPNVDKDNRID